MHLFPTQNRFHIICCFDILSISLIYIYYRQIKGLRFQKVDSAFIETIVFLVRYSSLLCGREVPPPPPPAVRNTISIQRKNARDAGFSRMWCITTNKRKQETEMLSLVYLSIHDSCSLTSRNNPIVCYRATFTRKFTSAVSVPMKGIAHTVVNTALCWLTVYERMQGARPSMQWKILFNLKECHILHIDINYIIS